jgi:hypothetical protein
MQAAAGAFGRPQLHSGVGIRRLGRNLFECRVGTGLRLLFRREADSLIFVFAGNRDEVRGWLSNLR